MRRSPRAVLFAYIVVSVGCVPAARPTPEPVRYVSGDVMPVGVTVVSRGVADTAPYFHDGSAPSLDDAVRKMATAQLNLTLTDQQVEEIVAYLRTLTGNFRGRPVGEPR